jgi:hypothetical protein
MKTMSLACLTVLVIMCQTALGQSAMYDQNYTGPTNYYGHPTYQTMPRQNSPEQQAPQGILPMAGSVLGSFGGYLWSYMPAPVTGAPNPYHVTPGTGQVNTTFVPGAR